MSFCWEWYGKNSYKKLQLQDINDVCALCIVLEYATKAETFCTVFRTTTSQKCTKCISMECFDD